MINKKILPIAISALLFYFLLPPLTQFCEEKTAGFKISAISFSIPENANWRSFPLSKKEKEEIFSALQKPFYFLSSGNQSFVFESEDGRYVLKFFRKKLYLPSFWVQSLPEPFNHRYAKKIAKREDKLRRDFNSYALAVKALREETGVLYVHLQNTKDPFADSTIIVDRLNIAHSLELSSFAFILQKKAELVFPHIERLYQEGDKERVKAALSSLVQLLASINRKQLIDSPPDFDKNFGFLGERAVEIDVGKFSQGVGEMAPPIIKKTFQDWLFGLDPLLLEHFAKEYQRAFKIPMDPDPLL